MKKKPSFTTTIEKTLQEQFKATCAIKGVKMNEVLEIFMRNFIEEKLIYDEEKKLIKEKNN